MSSFGFAHLKYLSGTSRLSLWSWYHFGLTVILSYSQWRAAVKTQETTEPSSKTCQKSTSTKVSATEWSRSRPRRRNSLLARSSSEDSSASYNGSTKAATDSSGSHTESTSGTGIFLLVSIRTWCSESEEISTPPHHNMLFQALIAKVHCLQAIRGRTFLSGRPCPVVNPAAE